MVISGEQVRWRRLTRVGQPGRSQQDPHMVLMALATATEIGELTGDLDLAHTG